MLPLAFAIGEPADREEIRRVEETHAILELEAHTGVELLGDVDQACGAKAGKHHWHERRGTARTPPRCHAGA